MTIRDGIDVAKGQAKVDNAAMKVNGIMTVKQPNLSARMPVETRPVAATPFTMVRKYTAKEGETFAMDADTSMYTRTDFTSVL